MITPELNTVFHSCRKILGKEITSKSKYAKIVFLRWIYFRIAKDLTEDSLSSIGSMVNRDHATVLYGLKMFELDIRDKQPYWDLYNKCLQSSEYELKRLRLIPITGEENLLQANINLRARVRELTTILNRIPETIKTKYA